MADSPPQSRKPPAPADEELAAGGEGRWGLDLWNGQAWFNTWFYERLQWPAGIERTKLSDLRQTLPDGAWESLLLAIRNHLEQQVPLDMKLRAQLPDDRFECWQVEGVAERNASGQPVYLAGSMRNVP